MKQPAVYMMASGRNGTLYVGVTSNLPQLAYQHRHGLVPGFTAQYGCKSLVLYEVYDDMINAISREKQIKGGSRSKKLALIESLNPEWRDLYEGLFCARSAATKQSRPSLWPWIASLRSQ